MLSKKEVSYSLKFKNKISLLKINILRSLFPLSAISFSPALRPVQKKDAAAIGARKIN
ncbi:hypothetical protein M2372_005010 [Chryseobacterium sp. BIGb0232]|nr:hypothetical protein [Chryseobacterium sp. BIGb0232]ROS06635.1 hypothetical protein EDF65_5180 [Chryseobacterium nakagawai]